jgi:2-dehydropantoate 2-reductase
VELERMTDAGYSGTAQDLRKGRRTEIEFMNGYVARQAELLGLSAPTHAALTAVVKRIEGGELTADTSSIDGVLGSVI